MRKAESWLDTWEAQRDLLYAEVEKTGQGRREKQRPGQNICARVFELYIVQLRVFSNYRNKKPSSHCQG